MRSFSGLSIFLLLSIVFSGHISLGQDIPEITAEESQELTLNRNDVFDGESLWGYMNGGADIYLEYGFKILRVEELSSGDETIKLELYKMEDPISAFGIYSIKTFRCEQREVIFSFDCLNRFQFQLIYGDYYIQLINASGSEKAQELMIDIGETLLKKLDQRELIFPVKYLSDSLDLSLYDIKMVKGPLGIQNKTPRLTDYFDGIDDYQIYYAKKLENGERVKYYEIVFEATEMKDLFMENNRDKELPIVNEDYKRIVIQQKSLND